MPLPGSRTTSTELWLLPEDEDALGERIQAILPGSGWLCSHPGPVGLHQVHLHRLVAEAMACGGVQAFLPLPAGSALPPGVEPAGDIPPRTHAPQEAIVQLLRSRIRADDFGEHFASGRLAVRWFEPEVGAETHQLLTEQVRLIWRALRAATKPAVIVSEQGRRTTGLRIGPAAHRLVEERGLPLTRASWIRHRLAPPGRH